MSRSPFGSFPPTPIAPKTGRRVASPLILDPFHPLYVASGGSKPPPPPPDATAYATAATLPIIHPIRSNVPPKSPTAPPQTKKRPYRRTKRPKGYNDKSTITTTTEEVANINAYDAVLSESEDLLKAATEAQQLGRLKMASSYLLLLHARLVGLGRRFDRAKQADRKRKHDEIEETDVDQSSSALMMTPSSSRRVDTLSPSFQGRQQASLTTTTPKPSPPTETPKTRAAKELAKMLPSNIELDAEMVEHLAKAAAELHAARTGHRKKDILKSPDAREFLANTANEQGVMNAATTAMGKKKQQSTGLAWTEREKSMLNQALASGENDPKQLAKILPGKTEQQVKVFLRNRTERNRVKGLDDILPGNHKDDSSPKKKGGRGRKPATTAISTVPNAVCDARVLLSTMISPPGANAKSSEAKKNGDEETSPKEK